MNYTTQIDPNEINFNDKMTNTTIGKQLKQLLFMKIVQYSFIEITNMKRVLKHNHSQKQNSYFNKYFKECYRNK